MKTLEQLNIPKQFAYSEAHTWVSRLKPHRVGVTDYAQDQLGALLFVDLPSPGAEFSQGEEFGALESAKSISSLYMPVSGKVKAINPTLTNDPESLNRDPYELGWLLEVELFNPEEVDRLLDESRYLKFLAK